MSEHDPWAWVKPEDGVPQTWTDACNATRAALRPEYDRVARMCQETAQTLNEVENELERVVAERDAMEALLVEAREELTHHGWGDFHYGPQPQDASVVAIITKIDGLLAEGGAQ